MAIYHFSKAVISRSAARSSVAAAAYRAGEKLTCFYYGEEHDYTKKGGVIYSEILLPEHAPTALADREVLWNSLEYAEKHPRAQLAYSYDIALPNELSMEENIALAREFVQENFVAEGMIADLAIHMPDRHDGGIPNPHFHVMCPIRPLNDDGTWGDKQHREYVIDENANLILDDKGKPTFNAVATTDWGTKEFLIKQREAWANFANQKLSEKGLMDRIDHRSYADQGIDKIPQIHEGPNVRKMEKRGIKTDKGNLNRWIKEVNSSMKLLCENIAILIDTITELMNDIKEIFKDTSEKPINMSEIIVPYMQHRDEVAKSYRYGKDKATIKNIKMNGEILVFLRAKNIYDLDSLNEALVAFNDLSNEKWQSIKQASEEIKSINELITISKDYPELKTVFDKMPKFKIMQESYKEKHKKELAKFYRARRLLPDDFLNRPDFYQAKWESQIETLNDKINAITTEKKSLDKDYKYYKWLTDAAELYFDQKGVRAPDVTTKSGKRIYKKTSAKSMLEKNKTTVANTQQKRQQEQAQQQKQQPKQELVHQPKQPQNEQLEPKKPPKKREELIH